MKACDVIYMCVHISLHAFIYIYKIHIYIKYTPHAFIYVYIIHTQIHTEEYSGSTVQKGLKGIQAQDSEALGYCNNLSKKKSTIN